MPVMPVWLHTWRQAHGLSQRALGAKLSVTATAISNWECGRTVPTAVHRQALAALISCTPDDVVLGPPRIAPNCGTATPQPGAGDTFGLYARRCRLAAKVSLHTLAQAVRLAPVEIQAIEAGEQPPPHGERLQRWAELLGGDPDAFAQRAHGR